MDNKIILDNKVSLAIYEIVEPYIEKYYKNIVGIYLYPYRIGETERIEIVVVNNDNNEILSINQTKSIQGFIIYSLTRNISLYNKKSGGDEYLKLSKELKDGHIIYDPKYNLINRQRKLIKDNDVQSLYNFIDIPVEVINNTKKMIKLMNK